jgi:site-specific DNA-methyltransferase (adenine-specific)
MTTKPGDLVLDPMCGSGTTGAVGLKLGFKSILNDHNEEYLGIVERRLSDIKIEKIEPPIQRFLEFTK